MKGMQLFKKFMMPCGICAAVPVIKPSQTKEETAKINNTQETQKLIKPSELPIYTFENHQAREPPCKVAESNVIEQGIGSVRRSVQDFLKQFENYKDTITNTIDTGYAHSKVTLDYLREESNTLPRAGAVGMGAMSGLVLALRGGKFKKLVYTTTGALVIASICYPKEAQEGVTFAKYYVNIGYNFLYGVKPGEKSLEISWPELPKVPTNFSDLKEIANNTVGTLAGKAKKAFNDFAESPVPPNLKKKDEKN